MSRTFTRTRTRRTFHHPSLATEVLAAARRAVEEEGGARLSLRAVAKASGVYPTAINHHFVDREGLLAAVAIDGFDDLSRRLEAACNGRTDGMARVRGMLEAYIEFANRHPRLFAIMFTPWSTFARRHPALDVAGRRSFELLREEVGRWVAATGTASAPGAVTDALWCTAHGIATLMLEEAEGRRRRRFDVGAVLDVALRALSPSTARVQRPPGKRVRDRGRR